MGKNDSFLLMCLFFAIAISCCSNKEKIEIKAKEPSPQYGCLKISLCDADSKGPLPARFYITGSDNKIYLAEECLPYEKGYFGTRIGYSGKHFTTFGKQFLIVLPVGTAKILIERGKEYTPVQDTVTVKPGETVSRNYEIKRWINMAKKGWYSGDLHVHRPLEVLGLLMKTEDLNVAVPQTVWGEDREPELEYWLKKADGSGAFYTDDQHVFSVLGHEIERFKSGSVLIHHTGKNILPIPEYEKEDLPDTDLIALSRKYGSYVEAEKPWWPESHIVIALGKADFTEIINNHFTYKSYLPEHARLRSEFKADYPDGITGYAEYVLDLYYAYLNCGFRLMPSAGSASGVLPNPLGYNRMYVKVDGKFTYDNWFKALKSGRSFATNGPMLIMTVDGMDMGDTVKPAKGASTVKVACTIYSIKPLDRLEIICDGKIVYTTKDIALNENSAEITTDIPIASGCWIAARCFEKKEGNVVFAHTSPVFVEIPGKPFLPKKYAAEYFLKKTKELIDNSGKAEFVSEAARKKAQDVYAEALKIYSTLLEKAE